MNFGSKTMMSTGDSQRRVTRFALSFCCGHRAIHAAYAELCDYVLSATSFLEMGNLAIGFGHGPKGKLHLQYRSAVVPPFWLSEGRRPG